MPQSIRPRTVLVVDDEAGIRRLIAMVLRETGALEIVEAQDGKAALDLLSEGKLAVDLIISDWNMPNLSGIELLRRVRAANPDQRFVMLSSRMDEAAKREALACGANVYLTKPFDPDALKQAIGQMLDRD